MTCHRFDGKVGYQGQKYTVVIDCKDGYALLGWTELESGGTLLEMARLHPVFRKMNPHVMETKDVEESKCQPL